MTEQKLSRANWNNNEPTDTNLWLSIYEKDGNLPYATDTGHLVNIIDDLVERVETERAAEQERIIKLLESVISMCTEADLLHVAIPLIKGEPYDIYGYNWISERLALKEKDKPNE